MKFPKSMWVYVDASEKDQILQDIVSLWFNNEIFIVQKTDDKFKKGQLVYNKTALNKLKKILIETMNLADKAAKGAEENLEKINSIVAEDKAKKKAIKKNKEEMTTDERIKSAGLISLKPNIKGGKLIGV